MMVCRFLVFGSFGHFLWLLFSVIKKVKIQGND